MPLYLETMPRPPIKATRTARAWLASFALMGDGWVDNAGFEKASLDKALLGNNWLGRDRLGNDCLGGDKNFRENVRREYTSVIFCRCASGSCFARARARAFAPIFSL